MFLDETSRNEERKICKASRFIAERFQKLGTCCLFACSYFFSLFIDSFDKCCCCVDVVGWRKAKSQESRRWKCIEQRVWRRNLQKTVAENQLFFASLGFSSGSFRWFCLFLCYFEIGFSLFLSFVIILSQNGI